MSDRLAGAVAADETETSVRRSVTVGGTEEGASRTRVDLEHRGLDRLGEAAAHMRAVFESDGGWSGLLRLYADQAQASA